MEDNRNNNRPPQGERGTAWGNPEPDQPVNNPYGRAAFAPAPDDPYSAHSPRKQSGLGIASFVLALASVVFLIIGIMSVASVAGDLAGLTEEDLYNEGSLMAAMEDSIAPILIGGLLSLGGVFLSLVGLILGIVGAVAKQRRKTFAVIGIVLNGIIFAGTVLLFVILLAIGAASSAGAV